MRTTLNIGAELLEQALELTGFKEKTRLIREGLKVLVERESARRLAKLGRTQLRLELTPQRRSEFEGVEALRLDNGV